MPPKKMFDVCCLFIRLLVSWEHEILAVFCQISTLLLKKKKLSGFPYGKEVNPLTSRELGRNRRMPVICTVCMLQYESCHHKLSVLVIEK